MIVAALIAASCLTCACSQKVDATVTKGGYVKKSTYFSLMSYDGKQVSLDTYAGKPVLVIFLGSDCIDCKHASPMMKKLADTFVPKGLTVLGVTMDTNAKTLAEFAKTYELPFPLLLNGEETARNYRCKGEPDFYLLDATHTLSRVWIGNDGGTKFVPEMFKTLEEVTSKLNQK